MTHRRFKELPTLICTFKRYGRVCKTRLAGIRSFKMCYMIKIVRDKVNAKM
jgi:hypothetical protein